jgi:hypothetical protein
MSVSRLPSHFRLRMRDWGAGVAKSRSIGPGSSGRPAHSQPQADVIAQWTRDESGRQSKAPWSTIRNWAASTLPTREQTSDPVHSVNPRVPTHRDALDRLSLPHADASTIRSLAEGLTHIPFKRRPARPNDSHWDLEANLGVPSSFLMWRDRTRCCRPQDSAQSFEFEFN